MLLIRPAFWSALLPRFPWCLGAIVPKLFPTLRVTRRRPPSRDHLKFSINIRSAPLLTSLL